MMFPELLQELFLPIFMHSTNYMQVTLLSIRVDAIMNKTGLQEFIISLYLHITSQGAKKV